MNSLPQEADVLDRLVTWGQSQLSIRAIILTSSRARPSGPVDLLSDYDIILAVTNPAQYGQGRDWLHAYGQPLVQWGDQGKCFGFPTWFRGVLYEDYVKIDYSIWPDAVLERIASNDELPDSLDVGYRVLLDKDGRTASWNPPTYTAHIPHKPTEAEYQALVEEFWWESTYVAKNLWRDELTFAKFCLDYQMKLEILRRMLEWRIELDHDWSVKPGVQGRGLKRLLPSEIWSQLADTYVGPEIEENWEALFRLAALFRKVSKNVAAALGYQYPQGLDDRISAYLQAIRRLPRAPEGNLI